MTACPPHSRRRRIDFGLQGCWDPDVRRDAQYRTYEALRRHTDERVGIAVHADRATDQPLIGIKEALPQCMRNDRDAYRRTKAVILRGEAAAKRQADTKNIEVVAAHQLTEERFREAVRVDRHRHLRVGRQ